MMKLCAVVMFITFLLHREGMAEIKPISISRNDSLGVIYWHFQILETLNSATQICQEYGMTLFSIKRHKTSFMELLLDKVRKFIEGSKGQIMLEAFVCQRHLEHENDYFHRTEEIEVCAEALQSVRGNHFQCAFYCSITKNCVLYCLSSHVCFLYSKCTGTCPKMACLKKHHCFAKV
ncbi:uncharacterized protein LOC106870011 isoform X1 [Octopus bimaculoides]|uniref:C-type lectin domain-containing protein n=1 Tax=Octopus bimaculoides TaxID=37653 RepID=A0A0L8HM99_OCTBM|nr:uncharacterized protein LOC106870011 isoform X1 [Octopus bimaculoides]|eukprot:XP_014771457.1 PREDICTED: uncharacterized protein LOC106870011 isoform X1 [Octopus bimaculoides]